MTLQEALKKGGEILKLNHIEESDLNAWYLLEYATGISRAQYYADREKMLPFHQENQYFEYIDKRKKHIPLQHITNVQEFMGLEFEVNEHVLIPRQDTEVLVETVLKYLKPDMKVLDMCTGSGCIIISLAKVCNLEAMATDISKEALLVAKKNARKHKAAVSFIEGDLFEEVQGMYDVIVSNPPYIKTAVINDLQEEVRLHDPQIALDGKSDGLFYYRRIIEESVKYLNVCGHLFFEIGYDQGVAVSELLASAGYTEVTVKKDLTGLDRVAYGRYNKARK